MRTPVLLVGAALALSGCATVAQGATTDASPPAISAPAISATPTTVRAVVSPSPVASPTPNPTPLASGPSPAASVGPAFVGPAPVGSFVLGDSISLSPGVGPVLGRYGYPVVGLVGQSVSDTYLTTHLSGSQAQAAPAWVIELGTNNSGDGADVARLAGWVDLIDGLRTPGVRQPVYWVAPYRPADLRTPNVSELDAFTAELARLAALHPWLRILDYAALARANPGWFTQDAMHLHPDAAGQAALVELVAGPAPVPVPVPVAPSDAAPRPVAPPTSPDPVFDNSTM